MTSTNLYLAAEAGTPTALIVWIIIAVVLAVFFIAALVSILGSRMTNSAKLIWVLICLILQFFGPLAWFGWGRKQVTA